MKTYRYTDDTHTVVHVIDGDGVSRMSMLASAVPEGEDILPFVAPPAAVPATVSPRQIRQALNRVPFGAGTLRQAVEAAVAGGDQDTRDWWEFATEFERQHPKVVAMGQGLGVSAADMDDLWILAGSL